MNYRRILALAGVFSLLFYWVFSWLDVIADPDQRTGSDFSGFYTIARIAQTLGFQHVYDIKEQGNIQAQLVGHPVTPIFNTHLPFVVPLAMAFVDENYIASFERWAVFLLLVNALNTWLLANLLELKKFSRENLFILGMGVFLFSPTLSGFLNGQDSAILLLGAALWLRGMASGNFFWAGMGLSLATVRPQIALFLAIPFFFRHRNVFWGFALGSLILAVISIGLLKFDGTLKFIESLRYIEDTVWHEPHAFDMPTLSGIIRRNFEVTDFTPAKTLVWICYAVGIAAFCVMWHKSSEINEKQIGLLAMAAIFLAPYAHYHELTLLLIPILCILRILEKRNLIQPYYLAVGPLIVSWFTALGFAGTGDWKYVFAYVAMFALAYLLLKPDALYKIPQIQIVAE